MPPHFLEAHMKIPKQYQSQVAWTWDWWWVVIVLGLSGWFAVLGAVVFIWWVVTL